MYKLQVHAMQAWYDAEVQRGKADPGLGRRGSGLRLPARRRSSGGMKRMSGGAPPKRTRDRTGQDAAATSLCRAYELAVDLQASPLLAEVEALAQSARISLAAIDESQPAETEALPGLTPREREVPAHIVAGRTYDEIARELVISEKTVSVHKTGITNRVELAQLARRVATSTTD
jgi:DNA-binding CsgD family transcriptional regulator